MAKNMKVALLYDFYGEILTEKQRDMIEQYYHQDLSLSEIAENVGISRQGVRGAVKRAEELLFEMEERLGLAARLSQTQTALKAILAAADTIREDNAAFGGPSSITDEALRISSLAAKLI